MPPPRPASTAPRTPSCGSGTPGPRRRASSSSSRWCWSAVLAQQLLARHRQHDPHRRHRRGRAEHPRRLHRPDLARARRVPRGGRLHLGDPRRAGRAARPGGHRRRRADHRGGRRVLRAAGAAPQGPLPGDRHPGVARRSSCSSSAAGAGSPRARATSRCRGSTSSAGRSQRETFELQWYWILAARSPSWRCWRRGTCSAPRWAAPSWQCATRTSRAEAIGVNLTRAKLTAFAVSSGFVGLAGALPAHYTETVTWERFTLDVSVLYLAMIIVGGLGSIAGSVYGAIFMMLLPAAAHRGWPTRSAAPRRSSPSSCPRSRTPCSASSIITFLIFEPRGLNRIWARMKDYSASGRSATDREDWR